jgi:hypothetical protein
VDPRPPPETKPVTERLPKRLPTGFRPPRPSGPAIGLGKLVVPAALNWGYGVVSVEYRDEEVDRLRRLSGERVLLAPNHPTTLEPVILFHLSRRVRDRFYYVANREAFDRWRGLLGLIRQLCGAYSIVRGTADRESFRMTRRLMSESPVRLVIFPEGEVYSQNDSLLPFHAGVFQLCFYALQDMAKAGVDAPLYVQPVAIRYRYVQDMTQQMDWSMSRLERALGVRAAVADPYQRLRRIGGAVLSAAERMYGLEPGSDEDFDPRIGAVKETMIAKVATALGMNPDKLGESISERMRTLINVVHSVTRDEVLPESIYQARLLLQERERVRPLLHDLDRLANWVAVHDHYVAAHPSPERQVEVLRRIEIEVFGKTKLKGRRKCAVRLAEAFDLRDWREAYSEDKFSAVQRVTRRTEAAIQALLDEMGA